MYGTNNGVRSVAVVGGMDYLKQKLAVETAPHFVVATPGRLFEVLSNSEKAKKYLSNLNFLVLDEVDKLLDPSLYVFVEKTLAMLKDISSLQRIFSTATIDENDIKNIEDNFTSKTSTKTLKKVILQTAVEKAKTVTSRYLLLPNEIKDCYLYFLLQKYQGNDIIVFVNSCE